MNDEILGFSLVQLYNTIKWHTVSREKKGTICFREDIRFVGEICGCIVAAAADNRHILQIYLSICLFVIRCKAHACCTLDYTNAAAAILI